MEGFCGIVVALWFGYGGCSMIAFILNVVIILIVMKIFFKFMYPKPSKDFFAKEGDDITIRTCDYCGHSLATYRGILKKDESAECFFCNDEHHLAYLNKAQNKCVSQNGNISQ